MFSAPTKSMTKFRTPLLVANVVIVSAQQALCLCAMQRISGSGGLLAMRALNPGGLRNQKILVKTRWLDVFTIGVEIV